MFCFVFGYDYKGTIAPQWSPLEGNGMRLLSVQRILYAAKHIRTVNHRERDIIFDPVYLSDLYELQTLVPEITPDILILSLFFFLFI